MAGRDDFIREIRERLVSDKLKLSEISGFSDSSIGRKEELNATLAELRERNELLQKDMIRLKKQFPIIPDAWRL